MPGSSRGKKEILVSTGGSGALPVWRTGRGPDTPIADSLYPDPDSEVPYRAVKVLCWDKVSLMSACLYGLHCLIWLVWLALLD